jgi:hypothetical protein
MIAYVFPPLSLIQLILNNLILIALCWPSQSLFPSLLELLVDHPRLPPWKHLLWHQIGQLFHENPAFYGLHAWKLSSISDRGFSEEVVTKMSERQRQSFALPISSGVEYMTLIHDY